MIAAEQKYELETAATLPEIPEFIDAFRSNGVWDIVDAPMNDDVILVRKFGNEKCVLLRLRHRPCPSGLWHC